MSTPRVILRPRVPEDLAAIIQYLGERSVQAAIRFASAVPATLEDVVRFPGAGSLRRLDHPQLQNVRTWRIRGFKRYLIFYRPIELGIEVLAIIHGARDAGAVLRSRA
jgi:toxin ParE1/3/4